MSTPTEPVQPATPPTPAPPTPAPPVPQPPATPPTGQDPAAEIARLTRDLEAARAEAAKTRVNAKEQAAKEAREALLKQLSGDSPEPLTPEQLTQQLAEARTQGTAAQQQAADTARENAVLRAAQKLSANAESLLDSRSFMKAVSGLDTADPAALAAAVEQQLATALTANPALRAGPGVPRSGADLGGGTGSGDGALTLDAQIDAATKRRDFATVIRLKRQRAAQTTT